jgi:hypothetical protein
LKVSPGLEGKIIKFVVCGFKDPQAKKEKESDPGGDTQPQG